MSTGFDFDSAEPWEVSTANILPSGNHVVRIESWENPGPSKGNYPQVKFQFGNSQGEIRDWVVITAEGGFRKLVQLAYVTGVEPTDEEKQYMSDNKGMPPKSWLDRLVTKEIGIVVRDEEKLGGDTFGTQQKQTFPRVKGYVNASEISGTPAPKSDVPNDDPFAATASSTAADDDIPF